ncbi:MAG: hypothetical protein A2X84_12075 [Desulfuromonadaceae bacterium GWC2_58_13]|nr:MAG: hypothetical protein A2X84_12075 [Desulfuromonadaceae bacterium GWC2_58_13]
MIQPNNDDLHLWLRILARVGKELLRLPDDERRWLVEHLRQIQQLQRRIHGFFELADGAGRCLACHGACCEKGRNHLTLVNLLGFLLAGEAPPEPDFAATCPFLNTAGCRLDVERRPFNCVTFNCEAVEDALDEASRVSFYQMERQLRQLYEAFDHRYAGSSLRGLLIRAERLGERSFLDRL